MCSSDFTICPFTIALLGRMMPGTVVFSLIEPNLVVDNVGSENVEVDG